MMGSAGPAALPGVLTPPREDVRDLSTILPPWSVILHNDDHNEMFYVVRSIMKSVPTVCEQRAVEIMLEAHERGRALVTTCPLELAELYQERLQTFGLTATIEQA